MDNAKCPNTEKCPIFTGILKGTEFTGTYKKLYCLNGEKGRNNCKRFQVAQIMGKCPPNVLPNSTMTIDEIVSKMKG